MIHQSLIYQDKFGNAAMRGVWSEDAMVQRWLDFEAALAWAQGEVGIIPRSAAAKIARHCNIRTVKPAAIAAWHGKTGHVIVSLVKAFRDAVPDVGELFHFGPTTQDVLDTGLTLQIRDALRVLIPPLMSLEETVRRQARRYRNTVMAGRSEGQIGAPITLGHKLAVIDSELTDHIERMAQMSERLMWLTLFGATGVQSSFCHISDRATTEKMVRLAGRRLGLPVPAICMHNRTDRFVEAGAVLANLMSTLGEVGLEIRDLQRSEVAEVAEPWSDSQHSSSTMPQKQNPEISEWLEGLARLSRGYAVSLLNIQQQHERDTSRVPPEFHALPNLFLHAVVAVQSAHFVLGGMQVFESRMRENLMRNGGLIMSEAIMLLLAKRSGKKVWAHQVCHDIAMKVAAGGGSLEDALTADGHVGNYLSPREIRDALRPERYIGTAVEQVSRSTEACARKVREMKSLFNRMLFKPARSEALARH
ncbi:MAG: class-II fumarase/aspartase family protein [Betaproteobacteria bacterium]